MHLQSTRTYRGKIKCDVVYTIMSLFSEIFKKCGKWKVCEWMLLSIIKSLKYITFLHEVPFLDSFKQ